MILRTETGAETGPRSGPLRGPAARWRSGRHHL